MTDKETRTKIEKIFTGLYNEYEKGENWDKAVDLVVGVIKSENEASARKLKSDRRILLREIESLKNAVKKYDKENVRYKKVTVPNLNREILRLQNLNIKQNGR